MPSRVSGEELERERNLKYIGTARIKLEWLHLELNEIRHLNPKTSGLLKSSIQNNFRRLKIRNHIPAIINGEDLYQALQVSELADCGLPRHFPTEYPEMSFWNDFKLECLDGQRRTEAAKQAFHRKPSNKWRTFDLYLAGIFEYSFLSYFLTKILDISSELRRDLTEEYINQIKPSPGEISLKMR